MTFVAVDWSGARRPVGKIWLAEARDGALQRLAPVDSREEVVRRISDYGRRGIATVVGLDFSFSLPAWFCRHLGVADATELWRQVAANGESWLASCQWPFWGRPGKRRPDLPAHFRRTEERVGAELLTKPKSTFQVGGSGAVGTGSIRGMPYLTELRRMGCSVWPFDPPGQVTIVEIYPRALTGEITKSQAKARQAYLRETSWPWSDIYRRLASKSEDAFDAAVSALVMADRCSELRPVPIRDELVRVEGEIWVPTESRVTWGDT